MEAIRTSPEIQAAEIPASLLSQLRLFTREEYHAMGKAGILRHDERVELIEGVIVKMSPIGLWHILVLRTLTTEIMAQLIRQVEIDIQGAIIILNSEPQPDLVMIKPNLKRKAIAEDILLVVEVSDSTASYDKKVKVPLYARAGIAEYWLIERNEDAIHQYTAPKDGNYQKSRTWKRGETISSTTQPIFTIAVDLVLGEVESPETDQ